METERAGHSMNDTTRAITTETEGDLASSADLGITSLSERSQGTLFLCGVSFETIASTNVQGNRKRDSTAPRSATRERAAAAKWFDKQTQLLISAGLVCGIIPTSMRRSSPGTRILGTASSWQDGDDAAGPRAES